MIWLNLCGEPINVVIDDLIPCKDGNPAFTKSKNSELWVMLLEKAYAKVHGSYDNIIAGLCSQSFQCLTGAPTENYLHKNT